MIEEDKAPKLIKKNNMDKATIVNTIPAPTATN
jgi:hypothetical protein